MGRWVMTVTLMGAALSPPAADSVYRAEIEKWRQQRETRLKAEDGWLAVAGLFWLDEGMNRFSSGPGNSIALPAGTAPPVAGTFELRQGKVSVRVEPGVTVTAAGKPVVDMELRSDDPGPPDVLNLGRVSLQVIARSGREAAAGAGDRGGRSARAVLHLPRPDGGPGDLPGGALPVRAHAEGRRRRPRFQQGLQPPLRLHRLRDLPAASAAEPVARSHRSRRKGPAPAPGPTAERETIKRDDPGAAAPAPGARGTAGAPPSSMGRVS